MQIHNVSYFYLGNELWQVRCPHYPANETCYPGPNKTEYADIVRRLVSEMRAASPNHPLRLLTAMGNDPWDGSGWDRAWIAAIGKDIYAASDHDGYLDEPAEFTAEAVMQCAKSPHDVFLPKLLQRRALLNAHGGSHIKISADEWGMGAPWKVRSNFSVAHAVYAAAFLSVCTNNIDTAGLGFLNYFEPVNEGAIYVGAFGTSSLTPVGKVIKL